MEEKDTQEMDYENNPFTEAVEQFKSTVLDRFDEIANCLNHEKLEKDYSKKDGKINWKKVREIMRNNLSTELKEEWESMWNEQELTPKLVLLKTLTAETQSSKKAWRPKTGDINPQKLALEKKKLLSELEQLKKIHAEKKEKVESLKKEVNENWTQINEINKRVCEHNKTMDNMQTKIKEEFEKQYENHNTILSEDFINEIKNNLLETSLQGSLEGILS